MAGDELLRFVFQTVLAMLIGGWIKSGLRISQKGGAGTSVWGGGLDCGAGDPARQRALTIEHIPDQPLHNRRISKSA
ncbi:MAG: hypothetical protein K1X51_11235 [Rhodospirillaceae bacterium]|nr:hypothetical protein [Rhodospirillaceae bacterium]